MEKIDYNKVNKAGEYTKFMATLRVFKKTRGFELPLTYKKVNNDGETNVSFINKVTSEVEGFTKHMVGRYFEKTFNISRPSANGIEQTSITKPTSIICQVYIPLTNPDNLVFVVGSDSDSLNAELLMFSNTETLVSENIDMASLEKKSFTSGVIKLMGHGYNQANDTVNYHVRKIDGAPFRNHDPDFVSCDTTEKDVLEVMLNLEGSTPIFYVYEDGRITRRGREDISTSEFELLRTVYNIIKKITSL